jgi:hypothetical protein
MRDVGALAGVSLKTVSRVVNAERAVSPTLRARVERAIDRLGYRHNLPASNLRRGDRRTASIGLLLEDLGNPFPSGLHRAVEDVAGERGVMTLAVSCDEDPGREREALAALTARRVDGVIVMSAKGDHVHLKAEHDAGMAMVSVDRRPGFRFSLRFRIVEVLRPVVGFDRWCWPACDPGSGLGTTAVGDHDYSSALPRFLLLDLSGRTRSTRFRCSPAPAPAPGKPGTSVCASSTCCARRGSATSSGYRCETSTASGAAST